MVKLTQLNFDRAVEIDKFWKRDWSGYSLPDDTAKIIDAVSVNDQGRVIGYGIVKLFPELMLFQDMEAHPKERVESLKLLMAEAFRGIEQAGLPEAYCLVKDMRFARLVAKHFGFNLVDNPGVLLTKKMIEER
jgi:hypothetical protein